MTSNSPASIGFLSGDLAHDNARIRSDFLRWFEVAEDLNRLAMRVLPALQPGTNSNDGLVIALLFGRALTTFQAVLILAERGMMGDASVYGDAEKAAAVAAGFASAIGFMEIDELEPFQHLLDESPPAIRAKEPSRLNLEGIQRVAAAKAAKEADERSR